MARTVATNFTGALQYPYATAAGDIFKKEDLQVLAQAVDQHTHAAGKGLPLAAGAIPNGSITLAMLASDSVDSSKIVNGTITNADLAAGVALANLPLGSITRSNLTPITAAASTSAAAYVAVPTDLIAWLPQPNTTSLLIGWFGSVAGSVKGAIVSMYFGWAGGGTFQPVTFHIPDVNYSIPLALWIYLSLPSSVTANAQVYWGTSAGTISMFGNRSILAYEFAR